MNESDIAALARRLAAARLAGDEIDDMPRLDIATGWRVQAALAPHLETALGRQCGWKLGATSAGAMAFLGVTQPIVGRLFERRLWQQGPDAMLARTTGLEAEPEVILQLGSQLEVAAAWLGIEFNRPAIADPFRLGAGSIVADNAASFAVLCRHRLSLAHLRAPAGIRAALRIGRRDLCEGSADAVLDGPLSALAALQRLLADDPRGLQPGDYVATGAMCRSIQLPAGAVPAVIRRGARR
jgi:2-keto-4-pentenoate hydratase